MNNEYNKAMIDDPFLIMVQSVPLQFEHEYNP